MRGTGGCENEGRGTSIVSQKFSSETLKYQKQTLRLTTPKLHPGTERRLGPRSLRTTSRKIKNWWGTAPGVLTMPYWLNSEPIPSMLQSCGERGCCIIYLSRGPICEAEFRRNYPWWYRTSRQCSRCRTAGDSGMPGSGDDHQKAHRATIAGAECRSGYRRC